MVSNCEPLAGNPDVGIAVGGNVERVKGNAVEGYGKRSGGGACLRPVCGKSINEDFQETRLAEVRQQLGQTNRTILQIGRDCGFNDPDNLKRLFKRRYGVSMREWRRQNRDEGGS